MRGEVSAGDAPAPFEWRRRTRRALAAVGVCSLAALAVTWPLVFHLNEAIPLGSELEATVPVFSLWTLWWTADRAGDGFSGYWDAPFFHPVPGALAFSEPQLLAGLLALPGWAAGAPPALSYNFALLLLLFLDGVFAYRLARALRVPHGVALLAGPLGVTLPFVGRHLGVLPLVPVFGMAWTLEGLVRFGRSGRWPHAAWAAGGFVAQILASQQLTLLLAPFAFAAAIVALHLRRWRVQAVARLGLAGLVALLVVHLVTQPGRSARDAQGFERSEAVAHALSASPGDFLSRPAGAALPVPAPATPDQGDTAGLFPGIGLLGLALLGVVFGLRSRRRRPWVALFAGIAVAATLLAMGLELEVFGWRPFATLRALVPDLAQLRAVYRFAVVQQVLLPPLAGVGLAALGSHRRPVVAGLVVALGLTAAAENLLVPVRLQAIPPSPRTAWSAWLGELPEGHVVAHVPFPSGLHVSHYEIEAQRLFAQIDHGKPLVNGYSSFFPASYTRLQLAMVAEFPSRRLLCTLHLERGADILAVDAAWLARNRAAMSGFEAFLRPGYRDERMAIFHLAPRPGDCEAADRCNSSLLTVPLDAP